MRIFGSKHTTEYVQYNNCLWACDISNNLPLTGHGIEKDWFRDKAQKERGQTRYSTGENTHDTAGEGMSFI